MRRLTFVILFFALISFALFDYAEAKPLHINFGGKVITNTVPGVTCYDYGYGPVVTTNNVGNAAGTVAYNVVGQSSASGTTIGIYRSIPYYFPVLTNRIPPKPNAQVLGKHKIVPNFQKCQVTSSGFPIPTMEVTDYNSSKI